MSDRRITKFNKIVGNAPVGMYDEEAFWKQMTLQAKLVLEEAQEMMDACEARDLKEVVDAQSDVWYLNEYAEDLLEFIGVDMVEAHSLVCHNNDQKYTMNAEFAYDSAEAQKNENGVKCVISEVQYDGDTYYVVKRASDGKVMKLINHQAPDLNRVIPENLR